MSSREVEAAGIARRTGAGVMAWLTCATVLLTGCQASPSPAPPAVATPTASPALGVTATPSATTPSATRSPNSTPSATPTASASPRPSKDTRKNAELAKPYRVNGIIVVSKQHAINSRFSPAKPTGPYSLEPEVAKALARMTAAARADGVRLVVRSGYRSYATQAAIFKRQLATYPSAAMARRYNAVAGQSEHQTGLAVDLWDGVTWGLAMARTKAGVWLWRHAPDYGFILRYPPGKEKITGYAYEPWHFRYLGPTHSQSFTANSKVSLEEYLGLA
ncbi:MAG: D-alanyl-D-alanine carboxypeptidase family protein [Propionicimonas sp.]